MLFPAKKYTNIIDKILKEHGYSAVDVKTAFGELAFYTVDELKAVHEDNTKPVITRIIANQFILALKKGEWNKVKEIMEHVIGKPTQPLQVGMPPPKIQIINKSGAPLDDNGLPIKY